ncbi:MAG: AAA family ATPase [Actinomycetota bacterium]|nr:AAA family ATPase [Actinomycetota bacterium]
MPEKKKRPVAAERSIKRRKSGSKNTPGRDDAPQDVLKLYLKSTKANTDGEWEAFCPLHDDHRRSASFNFKDRVWNCHAKCGGGPIAALVKRVKSGKNIFPPPDSAHGHRELEAELSEALPSEEEVDEWHEAIDKDSSRGKFLREKRKLKQEIIERYKIGWDSQRKRYTIPIRDDAGELVNVRFYDPSPSGKQTKFFSVPGHGERRLFPIDQLKSEFATDILVCAGEMDTLCAIGRGFTAITTTGGETNGWKAEWGPFFEGKSVSIIYDCDEAGRAGAKKVAKQLAPHAAEVRIVDVDTERFDGYDLTDFFREGGKRSLLRALIDAAEPENVNKDPRLIDGATFIFDQPEDVPAIWGKGGEVLWALDEGLMIVGPQGVGKTTLAQQLVLSRLGLDPPVLLEYPVAEDSGNILYLAMDRPAQGARSFRRMVSPDDEDVLRSRLIVWKGPLPFSVVHDPQDLKTFVTEQNASTVFIDSLKDLAPGLTQDEIGSAVNTALQYLIAMEIQVVALHHGRKANADNKRPDKLEDVYGSVWLTAGMGSVVLLWGKPGSDVVELTHLKQPAEPVGPLRIVHDRASGRSTVEHEGPTLDILLMRAGKSGLTLGDASHALFRSSDKPELERTRRLFQALVKEGVARYVPGKKGGAGGGGKAPHWYGVETDE